MFFSEREWLRYTRHLQLPQLGVAGQRRLKNASVLIVGAGGLGSPVSLYLAAAGVGKITIVDGDSVDLTNLQRQIAFAEAQVGQAKAECARERLLSLNNDITVTAITEHFTLSNAEPLVAAADLVLDCTDNFATRYLINDTCVRLKKPWLFASIYQFSGQCALFTPASACFRCLFPDPPQGVADCNDAGVLGVLPGLLGTLQASEAVKYLVGLPLALENTLLMVETMDVSFNKIQLAKNPTCSVCSQVGASEVDSSHYEFVCNIDSVKPFEISLTDFSATRDNADCLVLDVRSDEERLGFHIGGEHIPLDVLDGQLKQLPKDKTILCYCQTGVRSHKASVLLNDAGWQAKSLQGGLVECLKKNIT